MWASAPTGVTRTRRPGKHTGLPLIPSRRGRRPRRPASTARPAPAERGGRGIRALPGLEDSPRGTRFIGTSTRNRQPSLAGGRRDALAQPDPPWRFFLLDRPRPVFFLSRTKRKWGVESRSDHCTPPRPTGRITLFCAKRTEGRSSLPSLSRQSYFATTDLTALTSRPL